MESIEKAREAIHRDAFTNANLAEAFGAGGSALMADTLEVVLKAIEAEIAERYMELPLDVDGVPIHVGDMIQQINHAGVWTDAVRVVAVDENGCFALTHGLACEVRTYVWGNNCRHVRKRTIEDVLQCAGVSVAAIGDVAAEIRELMGVGA